ncbi:hypothetical protein IC006_1011 [Sulfuracidifex tepidarius]|uniref:Uncharacterized protein n=1 Tax=Sulfuracidifex tepidarius TaxID=1294262 RepID=A0A510DU46_9CREN|nr:hypothetical protein IC006_1011 [Sulfuracidifex tepidarius]
MGNVLLYLSSLSVLSSVTSLSFSYSPSRDPFHMPLDIFT